jgi:HK97 family phage prohead protease
MGKKLSDQLFYRSFSLERTAFNKEEGSVDLSFSSEAPYIRWFGPEILLHGSQNVVLDRLKEMGAALFNHNPNVILGSLKDARIEKKIGRAKLFFDPDEEGKKFSGKVESGSLRGVSVGYIVHKFKHLDEKEEWQGYTGPAYIATKWEPYEISLTPIPADSSVGIGRDLARSLAGIEIEGSDLSNFREEGNKMDENEAKRIFEECLAAALPGMLTEIKKAMAEDARPKLRIVEEDGLSLLGRAGAISPEVKGKTADMILSGRTKDEVTAFLFEEFTKAKKADARDTGGDGTDGAGLPNAGEPKARISSFKDVSDADFFGGLMDPQGTII